MSKLEELIKEFCPNGVEYKRINEFTKLLRGKRLTKSQLVENGKYAVYHGSLAPLGYYNEVNRDSGVIIVNTGGIGGVGYSDTPFWCSDGCFCLAHSPKMVDKYVYYALVGFKDYLISRTRVGGVPTIDSDTVLSIKIPLPALPVQREIVRILDSFTLYNAELIDELTMEITARRKQYEYYRDKLLNFSSEIQFFALGDVIISLNTGLNPRQFFHLNTPDAKNYYVTIRELQNGKIVFTDKTDKINDAALKLCNNRSNLEVGDVLFSGTGTIGTTAIIDKPPLNWNIKEGVYAIKPNKRKINSKFLMYLLQCQFVRDLYLSKAAGGTVQSVPMGEMKKLKIPVPSIEVQERIVQVLDNFDAICSDLGIGLPAEIEKRQKQYEYYREKLLTFDGKYATILTERNGTERNGTERNGTERAGLIRLLQYVYGFALVRLGDIADIHTGTKPENTLENVAKCEYINAGTTNSGYTSISNCEGDCITTPSRGQGGIGFVGYQSNSFWLGPLCYCIRSKNDKIINKYLYYYLSMNKNKILELKKEGGVPAVNRSDLQNVIVKIPTLEKQKEIVEILDKFDSICNDLSAGLPAEIEYRQKQYEYYRDKLLSF